MQLTIPVSAVLCRLAACFHARQNEWNVHVFSHVLGVATAPPAVQISTDYTNDQAGDPVSDVGLGGQLKYRQGGGWFDCMWTSTTQHRTNACRAGVWLHGDSYQPFSDDSGCTKWTTWVTRRLMSVWSVAWRPYISQR